MGGSNNIPNIGFLIYFIFVLLIILDNVDTNDDINIYDIINKTNVGIVESSDDNCEESNHYYYLQRVCMNILNYEILAAFHRPNNYNSWNMLELVEIKSLDEFNDSSYTLHYYGQRYGLFNLTQEGTIHVNRVHKKMIKVLKGEPGRTKIQLINNGKLFAVRWSNLTVNSNGKSYQVAVILTIYRNGTISFYYENIPSEINSSSLISSIQDEARLFVEGTYYDHFVYSDIKVPQSMIKSNTLVYFKPLTKYCAKQTREKPCKLATAMNIKCYWCPEIDKCSNGADVNENEFVNNGCYYQAIHNYTMTFLAMFSFN